MATADTRRPRPRPKTLPVLLSERSTVSFSYDAKPKLTKLLVNVTIQGSVGVVRVVMSPENTVNDLIIACVRQYSNEGRRPFLKSTDVSLFDLHYSLFSLESLEREEKLIALGSRNFFLFTEKAMVKVKHPKNETAPCLEAAGNFTENVMPWLKTMDFLF